MFSAATPITESLVNPGVAALATATMMLLPIPPANATTWPSVILPAACTYKFCAWPIGKARPLFKYKSNVPSVAFQATSPAEPVVMPAVVLMLTRLACTAVPTTLPAAIMLVPDLMLPLALIDPEKEPSVLAILDAWISMLPNMPA